MGAEKQYYDGHLINFSSTNGYPTIWNGTQNILLHRYVWEKFHGKIPKGFEIHHKDKNRRNYDINNLELVSIHEHHKKHAIENKLGVCNKGKLKKHSSGFCDGAKKVVLIKNDIRLEFESVTACAQYLNVKKVGYISRVLTGKRKSIYGWRCVYAS